MKKEELTRAIDAINPSRELRAKVLSLRARPTRPRLEHPLHNLAALGVAGLLCAGVVIAVMILKNGANPSSTIVNPAASSNTSLAAGPGDETVSPSDGNQSANPDNNVPTKLEPTSPKLSPEQDIGADMANLDYASDNTVIFHGYFGLFVYDLNSRKIVRSLDLKPIGCAATQGDDFCSVSVSADGNTVQLHPVSNKNMYVYTVSDNTLRETVYEQMENRFTGFVDTSEAIGPQNAGSCSYQAVRFDIDDYGYLHTSDWTLGTLTYVRGDTVNKMFGSLETPVPADVEPTAAPRINAPKLADIVKISEKGGKYYADIKLNVIAAAEGQYGLDPDWVKKAVDGEFTKEEILAEFALADERAAHYTPPFEKLTLPDGIIPPDEAISIAKGAFLDYFGIGLGDCVLIDGYSYSQMTLWGRDEPIRAESYAGKYVLIARFSEAQAEKGSTDRGPFPYQWTILFNKDGSKCMDLSPQGGAENHTRDMVITIDAATGAVISGSIDDTKRKAYTDAEQKDRMTLARQYVEKHDLGQVMGGTIGSEDNYVTVTLTGGWRILVWIRDDGIVVGFLKTPQPNGSENAG